MPITDISRRGTSTILGTLIFVGIMFTAVIPMLLVMRQADTLHEMRKHQLEIIDEEKEREYLRVRISPVQGYPNMTLKVENKGELVTKVIRIWINEKGEDRNFLLNTNEVYLETLVVSTDPDNYSIIMVTEKGNLFVSDNSLDYDGSGLWVQDEEYAIYVQIASEGSIFRIEVTSPGWNDSAIVQKKGKGGTAFKAFILPGPGIYNVKIKSGGITIYDEPVTITDEERIVWVP